MQRKRLGRDGAERLGRIGILSDLSLGQRRELAQALAPLIFGGVSQLIAGIVPGQAPIGTHPHAPSTSISTGLQVSFLIMLIALVAAGLVLFRARATFPSDVATAAASEPQAMPSAGRGA